MTTPPNDGGAAELTKLAAWVMANSEPAGEIFGFSLRSCRHLPDHIGLFGYADRPDKAIWIIAARNGGKK